jgi:acetyl-CoA carboxylase beta subunit
VSAVKAGPYRLCWRVNAGLYGKARAVPASGGGPISGEFKGDISNKAPKATVGPDGHTVIEQGD